MKQTPSEIQYSAPTCGSYIQGTSTFLEPSERLKVYAE